MSPPKRSRRWRSVLAIALLAAGLSGIAASPSEADTPVHQILSSVSDAAGGLFTATNHLVDQRDRDTGQFLVVWAGDVNVSDNSVQGLVDKAVSLVPPNVPRLTNVELPDLLPGQDFLAVIDVDPDSDHYGQVVNTVTVSPLVENEPHHMQYVWHKGQNIYAGSLYLDTTYVFDATQLPLLKLTGVNIPTDTPCGSVPDAYWVLNDGTAYGTYMGGPDVPGPCLYTNGETRIGNGFAGTPGSLVRIDKNGNTLSEVPADTDTSADRDPVRCPGLVPVLAVAPSCANPHGIQVREDLNRLITGDYAEPINVPISVAVQPLNPNFFRDTVRIWDISDRDNAKVVSVIPLPDGPRRERNPVHEENRGIMEVTVTNQPHHKGAFAEAMCGGAIYYAPDITDPTPVWRQVFDVSTAAKEINPLVGEGGGCTGGGWLQTSGDDHYLYHAVIGRGPGSLGTSDVGSAKMVLTLDIQDLLAAGTGFQCNIDTLAEVYDGGAEADCPKLADALEIPDLTSGGPHWGALDNFEKQSDGTYRETRDERRFAVSNYFVGLSGVDGNHKVNIVQRAADGTLSFDKGFRDEYLGTVGIDFNRTVWPHGATGAAKPHSSLFVVKDALLPADSAATGPDPGAVRSVSDSSAQRASITAAAEAGTDDVPVVDTRAEVPTTGELTEVASALPVSSDRSSGVVPPLSFLAVALGALLVVGTGVTNAFAAHSRRRSGGVRRRPERPARRRRGRLRAGTVLGSVLTGLWIAVSTATPAAAHAAGGGGASGVAGARAAAVGLALVTLALLVGPLVAASGPVDRVRGALGRVTPLAVAALSGSIDLSRPAQVLAVGAAAAVTLAPGDSRWRAGPAVVLLVVTTAGGIGDLAVRDRVLGGLHVLAGAVWLGLVIEVAARWVADPAAGRRLLHRLSAPALGALVVVATTGALVASEHLGDARLALGSWWGKGLAAKIALVVAAALIGALVRRGWAPRVEGTVLAGVAVIGIFLAATGSPLSGAAPRGPFLARDGAADVLVAPLQAGRNTVVVRAPNGSGPAQVEVDGRTVALTSRPDGLQVGEVDLPEGRHRIRVGQQVTDLTIGPVTDGVVLAARLPDVVRDPDCLDGLAGLAAAAEALGTDRRPVRFELEVGGDTCGPPGGLASLEGTWAAATVSAVDSMRARGTTGPLVVVTDAGARAQAVVAALRGSGHDLTEVRADRFDAAAADAIELGSLVVVATDRSAPRAIADGLATANGATVPVVLAPWLLDASVISDIADGGLSVLVATHRNPTAGEAVGYRIGAGRSPGGGWAITAAGFEAYLGALEELTGATLGPAAPGVYSAARVSVLPADLSHPAESGWATGVAMIRVA